MGGRPYGKDTNKPQHQIAEMVPDRQYRLMASVVFPILLLFQCPTATSFSTVAPLALMTHEKNTQNNLFLYGGRKPKTAPIMLPQSRTSTQLCAMSEDEDQELKKVQEEARVKILTDRRKTIRGILKGAEKQKNFRLNNGAFDLSR